MVLPDGLVSSRCEGWAPEREMLDCYMPGVSTRGMVQSVASRGRYTRRYAVAMGRRLAAKACAVDCRERGYGHVDDSALQSIEAKSLCFEHDFVKLHVQIGLEFSQWIPQRPG